MGFWGNPLTALVVADASYCFLRNSVDTAVSASLLNRLMQRLSASLRDVLLLGSGTTMHAIALILV